jgi:hypothetical protein
MSPALDERDRIRAAMDRILRGAPESSNGALTIVALALEAGVPRNALTQRHTGLKNDFYYKARARGGTPDSEQRLRKQVRRLKELRAAHADETGPTAARGKIQIGGKSLSSRPASRNWWALCTKPRWRTVACAIN